ncbi:MAG: hypothetical protein HY216_16875 [Candidatus Rokubacteria bacterium]|nr:hypothetical protein [Candidatus Rokubacteria bacterium]
MAHWMAAVALAAVAAVATGCAMSDGAMMKKDDGTMMKDGSMMKKDDTMMDKK